MAQRETDPEMTNRRLWHRLKMIEALEDHLGGRHWDLAAPGSDLAADDALTSPFQTSHFVGHCFSFAVDCLRTARLILVDPAVEQRIRLPMAGHFSCIRSAMEAGAEAIWLMAPEDGHERVTRTLRARWEDVTQDNQAMLALTGHDVGDEKADVARKNKMRKENSNNVRKKKGLLRDVAEAAGVPEADMLEGLPGYGPMMEEAAATTGIQSNFQYGMWRLVSGLAHPSPSRAMSMSVVEEIGPGTDKVMSAEFTASPSLTQAAIDAALMLHWHALGLASKRGGRAEVAWKPPPGFPLPPGFEHLQHQ